MSFICKLKQRWKFHRREKCLRKTICRLKGGLNTVIVSDNILKCLILNIVDGENIVNLSGIDTLFAATRIEINIYGDDNVIDLFDRILIPQSLHIIVGQDHPNSWKCNGALFAIGEHSSIESLSHITYNGGASCVIGKRCMISNVTIYNTDAHPIFDLHTLTSHNVFKIMPLWNNANVFREQIFRIPCVNIM